jgi:hypothetical protein
MPLACLTSLPSASPVAPADASNLTAAPMYPCSYNFANVICVTAIDEKGNLPAFASYGAKFVHLAAPGVGILSTAPPSTYDTKSGQWQGTSCNSCRMHSSVQQHPSRQP